MKLFCSHEYKEIKWEEYHEWTGEKAWRSYYRCQKCGKIKIKRHRW